MFKRQTGFTLIELIVVIVILGILTALPKFMGIQSGARAATLQGARGAVLSAMNIAYAAQASQGLASNANVTLDGVQISMVGSYPIATGTASGIYGAAGLSADYTTQQGGAALGNTLLITVAKATNPTTCAFSYTAANSVAGGFSPPVVAIPTSLAAHRIRDLQARAGENACAFAMFNFRSKK